MSHRQAVECKILDPRLGTEFPMPEYATGESAGLDLRACVTSPVEVLPGKVELIPSGMAIDINNPGLAAVLAPRSGLGVKHRLILANTVGIIDSDYHGEVKIAAYNDGDEPFTIEPGMRLCQMLFVPVVQVDLVTVSEFSRTTERGEGGFGHTGKH